MKKIHGWISLPVLFSAILTTAVFTTGCASFSKRDGEVKGDALPTTKSGINSAPNAAVPAAGQPSELDQLRAENQKLAVQLDELKSKLATIEQKNSDRTLPPATVVQGGAAISFKSKAPSKISSPSFINNETTDRFREALILFQAKKYSDAVVEFKSFVKSFGDNPLAPRAQYLAGQSYFKQNEYGLASEEWNRVLVGYPNSSAVAETLAGMAAVSKAVGNTEEAQYYEQKLNSRYPHARVKIPSYKMKEAPAPVPSSAENGSNTVVAPTAPTAPTAPNSNAETNTEKNTDSLDGLDQPAIKSAPVNLDEGEPE